MSDLNFSDSGVDQADAPAEAVDSPETPEVIEVSETAETVEVDAGEPVEVSEPAVEETIDLDSGELANAESEAEQVLEASA